MTDVYDWRGKPVEWEPDDVPGPTVEQLNALLDQMTGQLIRLQRECDAHESALTMVEEENAALRAAAQSLVDAVMAKHVILSGPPELLAEIDRALDATLPLVQEET